MNWLAFAMFPFVVVAGCSKSSSAIVEDDDTQLIQTIKGADEEAFAESNDEIKGGETFEEYDARRDSYTGTRGEAHGYGCTVDCGGHNAGYDWARDNGVTSADECGGTSWSFKEGCIAFAEENGG